MVGIEGVETRAGGEGYLMDIQMDNTQYLHIVLQKVVIGWRHFNTADKLCEAWKKISSSVIRKSFCGNFALSTVLLLYAMFPGIMDSVHGD